MRTLLECKHVVRSRGGTLAALAALHAVLVAWVGWYLAEAVWGSAPIAASPTPLPSLTFRGPWIAGTVFLLAVGPAVGASAMGGFWIGPDPTRTLPGSRAARAASAWAAAGTILAAVSLATFPVYLALYALGALAASELLLPALLQTVAIVLAPLAGIGITMARRPRAAGW